MLLSKALHHDISCLAVPYVELYRQMVIKRNRKDKDLNLDYIKKTEEIINGILGK